MTTIVSDKLGNILRSGRMNCPKCHSHRIQIVEPVIRCIDCGHTEPLHDYPISDAFTFPMPYMGYRC
jgi:Zn finger protein HypA/HybF involved in hydrogenase expression